MAPMECASSVRFGQHSHFLEHTPFAAFDMNDSLKAALKKAQNEHLQRARSLQFATVECTDLNRDTIRAAALSPDSVMQVAIQLAFYRTYKQFVPTYESSSTAAFKRGRTECIRSATLATRDAVLEVEKHGLQRKEELRAIFKRCSDDHSKLVKEAALGEGADCASERPPTFALLGQGFDRHLLGLRLIAESENEQLPALYTSEVYKHMNQFIVSTSTLSTETIVFGGFGPVVADGLGIGYNVVSSKLGAVISTYRGHKDAQLFSQNLSESLDAIRQCLSEK